MSVSQILEISDGLLQLDPVRTYPQRGAEQVARIVRASGFRLELADGDRSVASDPSPHGEPDLSLPLRHGRDVIGTLHLFLTDGADRLGEEDNRIVRWGARMLSRGIAYATRLASEGGRRAGEAVAQTLKRAPLTPRERDVVSLLVAGSSTRDIASRTGLTVSTVNTYLKRIFSKLGVHSRVELVARMAGTDAIAGRDEGDEADVIGDIA